MKRLKRIFTGTLPLFLLLWAGMMVILGGLTREKLLHEVQSAIESAREKAEYNYQRFWAEEATAPQNATHLSYRLDGRILASVNVGTYDGAMQFVLYDADGQELARTQLAYGTATPLELDGWMGLAVAVFILYSGAGLIKETLDPLLGHAPDEALVHYIHDKVMSYPGVLGTHDLMVHDYGPRPSVRQRACGDGRRGRRDGKPTM